MMNIQLVVLGLALSLIPVLQSTVVLAQSSSSANSPDAGARGENLGQEPSNPADLDLDQLADMDVIVTSASKKTESLFQAPAAIYVITEEEISRSGFATLPEALRMVPGLYVARTNSHNWAISARGFSDLQNNKLLVLVDGRSVYTPIFGGVFWDVLDLPLEDVERIEVIRGPGGTLWGANAVNGVINIVTKHSGQTQGVTVATSVDPDDGYTSMVQYGGRAGEKLAYRIFGKASYWEPFHSTAGTVLPNRFALPQAGVRADWALSSQDSVMVEGGMYDGRFQGTEIFSPVRQTYLLKGNHLLTRWAHKISERSKTETIAYCDWYTRFGIPTEMRNTCSGEFQYSSELTPRHSLIWGGSVFSTGDDLSRDPAPYFRVRRRNNVFGGFAQYELALVPSRVRLLVGSKIEHNGYTGFEYQPQLRAVWTPNRRHTLWGSFSRAVRVPSRNVSDIHLLIPAGMVSGKPLFTALIGNPELDSEHLHAYELGYRYQAGEALSLDVALYYNDYSSLIAGAPPIPEVLPTMIVLNSVYVNSGRAQTHGAEVGAKWRPAHRWLLSAGVTETRGSTIAALASPRHLFNLQSRFDLQDNLEFDTGLYHYNALPAQGSSRGSPLPAPGVSTFNRLDTGMLWHATPQWTFAVWGRNLQSDKHLETADTIFGGAAGHVPRSIEFKLLWHFSPGKAAVK